MKHITSRDNPLFKQFKALAGSTQQRRKAGHSLLDGVHLAQAYLAAGKVPVWCVVSERHATRADVDAVLAQVPAQAVVVLSDALFGQLSTVVNGIDLLLVIDTPGGHLPARIDTDCVILDAIQDTGNVGSILRSAAAAGIRHAFLGTGCAFAWSPKTLRAAMGAHFNLNIVEHCTPEQLVQRLAVPVYGTSSHAQGTLYELPLQAPSAWLMGNEGSGVTEAWQPLMTQAVRIPQPGGQESLNVAAAAAVCLFEMVRQRHH
ncbi:RNA methyltransferase [Imbroritus primus]|uniref:RNA methyltransferase n=1 Tax=Imbroritus primus TaxID=3058603 RepID=A0ACD3SRS2_9BURK|nr:RNA methyltransferase [Burkholderiaceae bacterium PBA]